MAEFKKLSAGMSNIDARVVAKDMLGGQEVFWDWDCTPVFKPCLVFSNFWLVPRTREGYYHYSGGVEAAINRVKAYAPHADLLWLETKEPNLEQARSFAREIRKEFPNKYEQHWST